MFRWFLETPYHKLQGGQNLENFQIVVESNLLNRFSCLISQMISNKMKFKKNRKNAILELLMF